MSAGPKEQKMSKFLENFRSRIRYGNLAKRHPAAFGETVAFYTYAFDTGKEVSFDELGERLLASGIAETVVAANSEQVRLAPRYDKLGKSAKKAEELVDYHHYVEGEKSFFELSWRLKKKALFTYLQAIAKYPIRRILATPQENFDNDKIVQEIRDAIKDLDDAVGDARLPAAAHNAMDRYLYSPSYLNSLPFYRFTLKPSEILESKAPMSDGQSSGNNEIEIELLLHRSGVALLTFVVNVQSQISADELSLLTDSNSMRFARVKVAECVAKGYASWHEVDHEKLRGIWSEDLDMGQRQITLTGHDESSLDDVFRLYQAAILSLSGTPRLISWLSCPTIFVDRPSCSCGDKEGWYSMHKEELQLVLAGLPVRQSFYNTNALEFPDESRDFSISSNDSFYVPGPFALELNWNFNSGQPSTAWDWFGRSTITENAVLQYWQIRCIDASLSLNGVDERRVAELVSEFSFGLDELFGSQFLYGTANEISKHHYRKLGGSEVYQRAQAKMADIKELGNAKSQLNAAKKSTKFAIMAFVAAVLFGLPAVAQSVDLLSKVPTLRRACSQVLNDLGLDISKPTASVLIFLFLSLTMLALIFSGILRREKLTVKARAAGKSIGSSWIGGDISLDLKTRRDDTEE